jgi:hypothetical protein
MREDRSETVRTTTVVEVPSSLKEMGKCPEPPLSHKNESRPGVPSLRVMGSRSQNPSNCLNFMKKEDSKIFE